MAQSDIRLAGHQGTLRQLLVYIGADPLRMSASSEGQELLDYRYGLVDRHRVNCAGFLV